MSDVAGELALLVADTLAAIESWRATGAAVVPPGRLDHLSAPEPWPSTVAAPPRAAPRPSATAEQMSGRHGPPRAAAAPVPPPAVVTPPSPAARLMSPRPSGAAVAAPTPEPRDPGPGQSAPRLSSLFGNKWQVAARDRGAEVDAMLAARGVCPDCGTAATSLRGTGRSDARLAIVAVAPGAASLAGEAGAMLDRMLLNVLVVERSDVWVVEANACGAAGGGCRDALRRQIDIVGPRLILGLGAGVGQLLGGLPPVLGEWSAWGEADVLLTFHPSELVRRPADKRPALDHLNTLRRRL